MKALASLILFILFAMPAFSQEKDEIKSDWASYNFIPDTNKYYLPAHKHISIYVKPDINSKIFTQTQSFSDSLRVVEVYERKILRFKNIYTCWCKVSFPYQGKRFFGYVPAMFLSTVTLLDGNIRYIVLLDSYYNNEVQLSLKWLNGFQLAGEQKFKPVSQDVYYPVKTDTQGIMISGDIGLSIFNNRGLEGIDRIVAVNTGVGACGYMNGSNNFLFAQNRVVNMITEEGVGDADVYHWGYEHVFPNDSLGQQDMLLRKYSYFDWNPDSSFADSWQADVKLKWNKDFTLSLKDSSFKAERIDMSKELQDQ